jgi:hypothetical protein
MVAPLPGVLVPTISGARVTAERAEMPWINPLCRRWPCVAIHRFWLLATGSKPDTCRCAGMTARDSRSSQMTSVKPSIAGEISS